MLFLACQGPKNAASNKNNPLPIGQIVLQTPSNIWAIFQDSKGNYWFGSNGGGLYYYDRDVLVQITTKDGLIDQTIRGIQEGHLGNIFIETPKGISKFDGKSFEALNPIIASEDQWKLMANDLWFNCNGNANDVYRYDGNKLYQLRLPRKDLETTLGINAVHQRYSPYTVFGIDKDISGNIWFGTVIAGAFRYDGTSFLWVGEKELSRLKDGREPGVRSMLEDKNGYLWLSNFKSKYKIEPEGATPYEKLPAIDQANELLKDRIPYFNSGLRDKDGNIWMTTFGGSLWKYDGETLYNYPLQEGTIDAELISIFEDQQGMIWLGTNNMGVYRFDGKAFEQFEH
ncbi:MAG: hypothetical protein Sapg2KO_36350 [Saprospiraceae bacterium]